MPTPIHTILCAADFSHHGSEVIRFSADLARQLAARLQVFHAVTQGPTPGTAATRRPTESARTRQTEQIRLQIQSILADRSASWEAVIRFGDPVDEIAAVVGGNGIDLVVAASYGLSGWKRMLLGTVVESMAAVLNVPLWVLPANRSVPPLPQDILIACELTADDPAVYELAVVLAESFESRTHWVNVAESPVYPEMIEPEAGPYGEVQQILQQRLQQQLIERQPSSLRLEGRCRTAILTGNAGEALIDYAHRHQIDLIVAGVHRKQSAGKTQISSSSLDLLRRAPCAVLTVPLGPADGFDFRRRRYGRQSRSTKP